MFFIFVLIIKGKITMKNFKVTFVIGQSKKHFLAVSMDDKWDIQKIRIYIKHNFYLEGEVKILKLEEISKKQKRKKHW